LILGVGNSFRGDHAAGIEAARRLRRRAPPSVSVAEREGDLAGILEDWRGVKRVIVIDAMSPGSNPGRVVRFDATEEKLPRRFRRASTHAFGLAEAVELGMALGRLPSLIVYGIEGKSFASGDGLSPEVEAAVEEVVDRVLEEAREG